MVRRHIHHLRRWIVVSALTVVFTAAVALTAGRWLLVSLPYYKADVEQLVSNEPHFQVRIGELSGRWVQLSPRLEARQVTVSLKGGRQVSIERVEFQFDPWQSVLQGEIVFNQVLLDQLDLSLFRSKSTGWSLLGDLPPSPNAVAGESVETETEPAALVPLLQVLLLQGELELRNAMIQVQFEGNEPLPPQVVNLQLQNRDQRHALVGEVELGEERSIELRIVSNRLPEQSGFSADLYLRFPEMDQRYWNQFLTDDQQLSQQFRLGGELWGRWGADGQHKLQGSLQLPKLRWLDKRSTGASNVSTQVQPLAVTPFSAPIADPPGSTVEGDSDPLVSGSASGSVSSTVSAASESVTDSSMLLSRDDDPQALLQLDQVAFEFQLQMSDWQQATLAIEQLQGQVDGVELPLQRLSLRRFKERWIVSSDRLALAPLWQQINGSPLVPETLKQRLAGLDPVGVLQNARFELRRPSDGQPLWFEFGADLYQVGVSAWHGAPALQGVDGLLQIDIDGGRVDFETQQASMEFPELYSQGWQFNYAKGVVDWQIGPRRIRVQSQRLQLSGDRVSGNARFSLELPLAQSQDEPENGGGITSEQLRSGQTQISSAAASSTATAASDAQEQLPGRLILMIGIEKTDVALAPLFVPDKIVPEALFGWLQQSIQAGQLQTGGLIIDIPFSVDDQPPASPTVQMFFDVGQAAMKYQPQWPAISQANPFVLYKDSELLVEVPQGKLLNSEASQVQVYLAPGSPILQVDAQLAGPAADIRTTLIEGPTAKMLAEGFTPWLLTGSAQSRLQLAVDLEKPEQSKIRISSNLKQGALKNTTLGLNIDQIGGNLQFHERDGLSSDKLRGRLFGNSVEAVISTQTSGSGSRTVIEASGEVAVGPLNRWLKQPLLNNLQGKTPYRAKIQICDDANSAPKKATPAGPESGNLQMTSVCSHLRIDSELKGVVANLPPPFAKKANQQRPLSVELSFESRPWLTLNYTDQLQLLLPLGENASGRNGGELVLGKGQKAAMPRAQGLSIRGHLAEADAEPWQQFISDNFFSEQSDDQAGSAAAAGIAYSPYNDFLQGVDLQLDRLNLGDLDVERLNILLMPRSERWLLQLDSPMAKGQVLLPTAQDEMDIRLKYLRLPQPDKIAESDESTEAGSTSDNVTVFDPQQDLFNHIDPRTIPAAAIRVDALSYGAHDLGRWQLALVPQPQGVEIANVDGKMGSVQVQADIDWQYRIRGSAATPSHTSNVALALKTGDLEQALQKWDSSMGLVTETALLSGQLNWQGSPVAYNWPTVDGEASLTASNGLMLDTGAGSQVLKIFSIFNTSTIRKRLSLDFSDLTKDGISFDEISGHYRLDNGVMNSTSPLAINGPTFDLQLEGSLDMVNDQIHQKMTVTLPISENLPVAAAFLVSPQIAGAVFLVEKLIGKKLSKFTSVRYLIDGDINDPQVTLIKPGQDNQPAMKIEN
ncbi:MAG: AsmA-like C-terminal region-containing protein [Motiliproteus sp.]